MRWTMPGCLLLALSISYTSAQVGVSYVVKQDAAPCLKFRPEPSAGSTPDDCLVPGTHVAVIESAPYWRKVRLDDGRTGWVAKLFIAPSSPPAPAPPGPIADAWLEVHFVDVGQGDAIWIHTFDDGIDGNGMYEGKNIAIDGGPKPSAGEKAFWEYIEKQGHHNGLIDALILSHPHDDHYPGADGIRRHFRIGTFYDPGYPKQGVAYPSFLEAMRRDQADGHVGKVLLGKDNFGALDWGSELVAEVLYAYPGTPDGLGSRDNTIENNASIVLRLQYGKQSFLFMGDAEGKDRGGAADNSRYVEKLLLDSLPPEKLKASVLKIAHHGSETSSTDDFIQAVDPRIVVVNSGRKNFGHNGADVFLPDSSTLHRYCCHSPDIRIYRTDEGDAAAGLTTLTDADGDHIVIRTNGTDLTVQALQGGQPIAVNECRPHCGG